jgi:hypothetical protein
MSPARGARCIIAVAALVAVLPAGGARAASAGPAAFSGTLKIAYRLQPFNGDSRVSVDSNHGSFDATYHLHGSRRGTHGAAARQYDLSGTGTEALNVFRHDHLAVPNLTSDYTFSAKASGTVTLGLGHDDAPRRTSPLLLTLKPGGRAALDLTGLEGGDNGVPLQYFIEQEDTGVCDPPPGTDHQIRTYDSGEYVITTPEVCPNEDPFPTQRRGKKASQTIWGVNVWASNGQTPRPNLCQQRVSLTRNLSTCGHFARGRAHGHAHIGPYELTGRCPFFPGGLGGLPDPLDPVSDTCLNLGVGTPQWRVTLDVTFALHAAR